MGAMKKLNTKDAGTRRYTMPLSSSSSTGAKHGTTVSKRLNQSCSSADRMRTKSVPSGKQRDSQSPTKTVRALLVKQVPTLPKKRNLQSFKKAKMLVAARQREQEKSKRCSVVSVAARQREQEKSKRCSVVSVAARQREQEKSKRCSVVRTFKSSSRSNSNKNSYKVIKKLSTSVQKRSAKPQNSRKTKSLPCSTTLSSAKRLCVRLERQSVPDSFTKKQPNKHALAKVASTSKTWQPSEDSSDNDILYSLAVPSNKTSSSSAVAGNNHSGAAKRHKRHEHTGADGAAAEPDTDSEISFRHSPLKHAPKKEFHKQKRKATCEPASPSKKSASAVTAATSPTSPQHHFLLPNAPTSNDSKALNFLPDLSGMPTLPGSPSAAAYKMHMANFSRIMSANRHGSRRNHRTAEEGRDEVVRRMSVRHSENAFKYKEIVVKKEVGYTQVALFTQTKLKNALNPKVFEELCEVLHNATYDDSRLVMLTGSRGVFCSGIDLNFLTCGDPYIAARCMSDALRYFISALIAFPKPIVAAVNGPSVGLGVALLPLCDIVYASDKASFYCPYARLCQTTEGCASFTFTHVMGMAMANEMLLAGRSLTALEAYQLGLVSQVFWPTTLMQEVMPRVQNMAAQSAKALEATKLLIRSHVRTKLDVTNDTECRMLTERWSSPECQKVMKTYVEDECDF